LRQRTYLLSAAAVTIVVAVLLFVQLAPRGARRTGDCSLSELGVASLPGTTGRIDHMTVSNGLGLLVVAARDNNSIAIVNVAKMTLNRTISGFSLPQAVVFVRGDKALVVTNGGDGTVSLINTMDFRKLAMLKLPSNADNLDFDSSSGLLYVGYGEGGVGIINTTDWSLLRSIQLLGHPEGLRVDMNRSLVFVNIPAGNYIAVLNKTNGEVLGNLPVTNGTGIFPMALDSVHHLLFVGSRSPHELVVINAISGAEIARVSMPGDADDIFYDSANSWIYISSGQAYVTVVKEVGPNSYQLVQSIATYPGARTSFLDSKLHLYFLAAPQQQSQPARIIAYQVGS